MFILHHHPSLNWNILPKLTNNLNFPNKTQDLKIVPVFQNDDPIMPSITWMSFFHCSSNLPLSHYQLTAETRLTQGNKLPSRMERVTLYNQFREQTLWQRDFKDLHSKSKWSNSGKQGTGNLHTTAKGRPTYPDIPEGLKPQTDIPHKLHYQADDWKHMTRLDYSPQPSCDFRLPQQSNVVNQSETENN
ncbi:hypothetical protein Tco_0560524 [Tanacetum coccineum]